MTTYTVTTNTAWDTLSAPSGAGHTVNINGAVLTIDTDTRYNAVFSLSTGTIGNTTISNTLGGELRIDGTGVRIIPYNSGVSGNVPAIGTTITQGGVSAYLLGVWSAFNAAPTAAGATMPASGYIKIKNKTGGNFAAGALTGIGASAASADHPGWIEVIGQESGTLTIPRLGTFTCTGDWFYPVNTSGTHITTSGSAGQTIQLPASLANSHYGGVWIETSTGSNVYEFYASAADVTTTGAGTDATRGKLVWISSQGLVRIGSDGTNTVGYVPPAGCKIRVPNILLLNATAASPSANAVPNTTLPTRYDLTCNSATISIDKVASAWYLNFNNAYSVALSNSAILSGIAMTAIASPVNVSNVVIGIVTGSQSHASTISTLSGAISDFYYCQIDMANPFFFELINGLTVSRFKLALITTRAAVRSAFARNASSNLTFDGCTFINCQLRVDSSSNITIKNHIYCDVIGGTTGTGNAQSVISAQNASDLLIDGLSFGSLTNVQSYDYWVSLTNIAGITIRNIGSVGSPLSLGSANISAGFLSFNGFDVSCKRVYTTGSPRTRLINSSGASSGLNCENLWADALVSLATGAATSPSRSIFKGCYGNSTPATSFTNVSDTIFWDSFTSATTGLIGLYMNESTSSSYGDYVSVTGTAKFTGTGALYLPTSGDTAEWEDPYYILGYTGLANVAPTITGGSGVTGRITVEYQLDKNDGSGFSGVWQTFNATNLSAETGISPSEGFKRKIRVIATSSDTNNTLTGIYCQGTTDSTSQQATYPLYGTAPIVAANYADGARIQLSHQQIFTIAHTAINTTTNAITLSSDSNGDAPDFSTSPRSLVRFNLVAGATIPTTSPQILDGGLYYADLSGSALSLRITSSGSAIDFSTQGSGSFELIAETELINAVVSGGSGFSSTLQLPDGARVRRKAVHWSTSGGIAKCSEFFDDVFAWSDTSGLTLIEVVDNSVVASQDAIHERLVAESTITLESAIKDASGAMVSTITLPDDGSTVAGLSFALEGTGKIQVNADDANGILSWQELYLWGCYIRSTAAGIRLASAITFVAINIYNYTLANLEFDNTSATQLKVVGGIGRSADGGDLIAATSGSINLNAVSQGTGAEIPTGGTTLTTEEREWLEIAYDRISELFKRQGCIPGISVTEMNPTSEADGYLFTSDSTIEQTLIKNEDGSITISRDV